LHSCPKKDFPDSLELIFASLSRHVAILGDLNLVRAPREKSNGNFNAAEAALFNGFINNIGVQAIPLLEQKFTWSNQQDPPILALLDRVLINPEWSLALPDSTLTSSSHPTLDHVPLNLVASSKAPRSTIFRMENTSLYHPYFPRIVSNNWHSVGANHPTSLRSVAYVLVSNGFALWQGLGLESRSGSFRPSSLSTAEFSYPSWIGWKKLSICPPPLLAPAI
jgi:hypothetical protein